MNKPYFEVGEEVIVARNHRQEFNGEDVIIGYDYGEKKDLNTGELSAGHDYQLSKDPDTWVIQSSLRKKHKPSGKSFQELITNLQPTETTI